MYECESCELNIYKIFIMCVYHYYMIYIICDWYLYESNLGGDSLSEYWVLLLFCDFLQIFSMRDSYIYSALLIQI